MDEWSRRDALRAVAVGTVGAVAGCTAESAAFRAGTPEYDEQDPAPYTRFMGSTDAARRAAFYLAPSRLTDVLSSVSDPVAEGLRRNIEWTGLAFEDVDHFVATGLGAFVVGDFHRSTARFALADDRTESEEAGDGDYEIVRGTPMSPILVGDGVVASLAFVGGDQTNREDEREIVDSLYGDWDGSVEGLERDESLSPRVRRVAEAVGAPPVAALGAGTDVCPGLAPGRPVPPDENAGLTGVGWTPGERITTGRVVFDYPDGPSDAETAADRYAEGLGEGRGEEDRHLGGIGDFRDRTVRADERTVRVQGEIETERFDLLHPGNPVQPDATFAFEYAGGEVTITHDGTDPIAGTNLVVTAGDRQLSGGFREAYRRRYVTETDSVTVSAESGATVRVEWSPSVDPEPVAELGSFDVP